LIIDAHSHIFHSIKGNTARGPTRSIPYGKVKWGENHTIQFLPPLSYRTSFTPEMLLELMDWVGVDKAILLQGPFYGEANRYVSRAVRRWPDRFIGAGYFDPRSKNAKVLFRQLTDEFEFKIIKLELSIDTGFVGLYPDLVIDEESMAWVWEEAEYMNLIMVLDLGAVGSKSYQSMDLRRILKRRPRLKMVIAHLAQPTLEIETIPYSRKLWLEQIELGLFPNVWFDMASLPVYFAHEGYPYPSVGRCLRTAVERIGVEKIMWGTDIPATLTYATYPQLLEVTKSHIQFLSSDEQALLLGGNALNVYVNC
jgi:predicted TIM-barrel fold metal-dependent hydrolase